MFIIYGKRLYGRVDRVPGLFHVATQFVHIFFVPLVPLGSYLVFDSTENDKSFRGLSIGLSLKSLLAAWLRAALTLGLLGLLFLAVSGSVEYLDRAPGDRPPLRSILLPLAGAFGLFVLLRLLWRFSKASLRRARDLAPRAGLDPARIEAVLLQPAVPRRTSRLRLVLAGLGLLLAAAGAAGRAGLLPLPHRFLDLDVQQVLSLAREHRYDSHYAYVRLKATAEPQRTVCFAWNSEPAPAETADRCFAPVAGTEAALYVQLGPPAPELGPTLTAVLESAGDAFLNKRLGRGYGESVPVLDLKWGAEEANRLETRAGFLLGAGALLLALALLWRLFP